jgi:hypothetical protein
MSGFRSKTITLEITHTHGNSKELRPWTADTHGTSVFPFLMYRISKPAITGSQSPVRVTVIAPSRQPFSKIKLPLLKVR